ncbi:Hypothetical protein FKW44_002625, partial [Caligus rogercresseyi]
MRRRSVHFELTPRILPERPLRIRCPRMGAVVVAQGYPPLTPRPKKRKKLINQ